MQISFLKIYRGWWESPILQTQYWGGKFIVSVSIRDNISSVFGIADGISGLMGSLVLQTFNWGGGGGVLCQL